MIFQDLGEIKRSTSSKVCRVERPPLLDWDMAVGFFMVLHKTWGKNVGPKLF
jgi:hypothetical protein